MVKCLRVRLHETHPNEQSAVVAFANNRIYHLPKPHAFDTFEIPVNVGKKYEGENKYLRLVNIVFLGRRFSVPL